MGAVIDGTASRRPTPAKAHLGIDVRQYPARPGVNRTLISTDLGQTINPPVAEGFAMFSASVSTPASPV